MSKESYIRGFCKAAEAAGVNPKALAKFAQAKYKTDGWAPDKVDTEGMPDFHPSMFAPRNADHDGAGRIGSVADLSHAVNGRGPDEPYFDAMMALDPRLKAWYDAHTNSVKKVGDKVLPYFEEFKRRFSEAHPKADRNAIGDAMSRTGYYNWHGPLSKLISDAYAAEMYGATNNNDKVESPLQRK